jgi:hypothetical protein
MNICICIIYGSIFTTMAEMSSCNRDLLAHKGWNIDHLALLTPDLEY